jgi:hypothetical protein
MAALSPVNASKIANADSKNANRDSPLIPRVKPHSIGVGCVRVGSDTGIVDVLGRDHEFRDPFERLDRKGSLRGYPSQPIAKLDL